MRKFKSLYQSNQSTNDVEPRCAFTQHPSLRNPTRRIKHNPQDDSAFNDFSLRKSLLVNILEPLRIALKNGLNLPLRQSPRLAGKFPHQTGESYILLVKSPLAL